MHSKAHIAIPEEQNKLNKIGYDYIKTFCKVHVTPSLKMDSMAGWKKQAYDKDLGERLVWSWPSRIDSAKVTRLENTSSLSLLGR